MPTFAMQHQIPAWGWQGALRLWLQGHGLVAAVLLALAPGAPVAATDIGDPAVACGLMQAEGLQARRMAEQSGDGHLRCASIRRSLPLGAPPGHEIRYVATGRHGRVESLSLELTINSRHDVQAAHQRLLRYTALLLQEAFAAEVPDDLAAAILSGLNGSFMVGDRTAVVRKGQIRAGRYEFVVSVETGG